MVVTSRKDPRFRLAGKIHCSFCEEPITQVPFIVWWSTKDCYLCLDCCRSLKRGLAADLIQIEAIRELNELGYRGWTLHREAEDEANRREQLEDEARHREIMEAISKDLKK